jgi:O-antigen/teichoic acid export membrane protein
VVRYLVLLHKPVQSVLVSFFRTAAWQPFAIPFLGDKSTAVRAIVTAWACGAILGTLWGLWIIRPFLRTKVRARLKYIVHGVRAAANYYVTAGASVVQGNLERFVLQWFVGPSAVGIFSFFQTIANTLPATIQASVINVSLSSLLTHFGQRHAGRAAYLSTLLSKALRMSLLVSAMLCVLAVPLVLVVSHVEYLKGLWILPILVLAQVLVTWTQPIHLALYGGHQDRALMTLSLLALLVSLGLNTMLVQQFGLNGAVFASLLVGGGLALTRWRLLMHLQHCDEI